MNRTPDDFSTKMQVPTKALFNIADDTSKYAEKTGENIKEIVDSYVNKNTIIIGLVVVIIVALIASYGLYIYISGSLFKQSKIIIDGTKVPILCNTLSKIPIASFNESGNGMRRSYTFWIYINDLNRYPGVYKHVFHIGDSDNIQSASPYVFLDKMENKINVRFAAIKEDSYNGENTSSVQNLSSDDKNNFMQQGIEIPYVPIQRWVHIAIVVNENSNGGTIMAYDDGDLSKAITTGEIIYGGSPIKINNLNLDKKGDLFVGGNFEGIEGPGFSGLVSKITMFNYDLNDKDIYNDYNDGPLDGYLSKYLGTYGLRSPIYKIS